MSGGEVSLVLDRPRHLRFDINAICDAEENLGLGFQTLLAPERVGLYTIRIMLWAGLKWEDRGLTKDQAGKLLEEYMEKGNDPDELAQKIRSAVMKAGWSRAGAKKEGAEEQGETSPP